MVVVDNSWLAVTERGSYWKFVSFINFSMDFFFKVFIMYGRLKQSVGQIRFCFSL
jgi:hypothetical protein